MDTTKPAEILLFEFFEERINASVVGSTLYDLELHDTIYQPITRKRGLRISDVVGSFSPKPDGSEKELDVFIELVCFVRVVGKNKTERQPALMEVFEIQSEVCRLIHQYSTLGGRVCDCQITESGRGYDIFEGEPFAVANVSLIINSTGVYGNRK